MRLEELFDVKYGVNLELANCQRVDSKDGINFVARTSANNGVVAKVAKIEGIEPQAAGTLVVRQEEAFYLLFCRWSHIIAEEIYMF